MSVCSYVCACMYVYHGQCCCGAVGLVLFPACCVQCPSDSFLYWCKEAVAGDDHCHGGGHRGGHCHDGCHDDHRGCHDDHHGGCHGIQVDGGNRDLCDDCHHDDHSDHHDDRHDGHYGGC